MSAKTDDEQAKISAWAGTDASSGHSKVRLGARFVTIVHCPPIVRRCILSCANYYGVHMRAALLRAARGMQTCEALSSYVIINLTELWAP